MPLQRIGIITSSAIILSLCAAGAYAKEPDPAQLAREMDDEQKLGDVQTLNQFFANGTQFAKKPEKQRLVQNGIIYAQLKTPLNSTLAGVGDTVLAEVTYSSLNGKPWLPRGTILEGTVDGANKATFGRTDGSIGVRFYKANFEDIQVELTTAPDNDSQTLKPGEKKKTKKQKIRGILMMATRLAVPMSIGTGGLSIAITTGAGAVIGSVLADDHKYWQGAVDGAWQGSGLGSIFDPVVRKGNNVVMPVGAPLMLKLTEETVVPERLVLLARKQETTPQLTESLDVALTSLQTNAKIISKSGTSEQAHMPETASAEQLNQIDQAIKLGNLAKGLAIAKKLDERYPEDTNVHEKFLQLLKSVTGEQAERSN